LTATPCRFLRFPQRDFRLNIIDGFRLYSNHFRNLFSTVVFFPTNVSIATPAHGSTRDRTILRARAPASWGVAEFSEAEWPTAARALFVACDALLHTLDVLELQFGLEMTALLAALLQKRSAIA
jgi:hypothetical protein